MSNEKYDPPPLEPTAGDAAHTLARTGLSALPFVGGPATELLNTVLAPPLIRRQQEWREQLAEAVRAIEEKLGVMPEELSENEDFIDAVLTASDIALRTSCDEKLAALRAAVENSASAESPGASLQQVYLNLVGQYTVWHIRILVLFNNPPEWFRLQGRTMKERRMTSSLVAVLEEAYPELRGCRGFYDQVWRELYTGGMVNTEGLQTTMTAQGASQRRTTELGQGFLAFITNSN
ncbi:MAG: hypothetical protein GY906_03890 [bacterium]|nr:hypothetical protein [bacterium]